MEIAGLILAAVGLLITIVTTMVNMMLSSAGFQKHEMEAKTRFRRMVRITTRIEQMLAKKYC